jgi:hypothetical protein
VSARQIALSPVRYDEIEIDVTGIATADAFDTLLTRQMQSHVNAVCQACGESSLGAIPPELCCLRVRLVGATPLHRQLRRLSQMAVEQVDLPAGRGRIRLDAITIDTRPQVDLHQLATGRSVAAELARLLLELDAAPPSNGSIQSLLSEATAMAEEISLSRAYQPLLGETYLPAGDTEPCVRSALRRQGMLLLDELLAQKDSRPAHVGNSSGDNEVLAP